MLGLLKTLSDVDDCVEGMLRLMESDFSDALNLGTDRLVTVDELIDIVSAIAGNPLRVEQRMRKIDDGAGGPIDQPFRFPVWFEARANGRTPMCQALALTRNYLEAFLSQYPDCYPPIMINITDGMSTDGDSLGAAMIIRSMTSTDGNVLLFNAHVSATTSQPIEFPAADADLADNFAKLLFRMSSPLPPRLLDAARGDGVGAAPGSRGFVFNADLVSVIRFLDIGTRVSQSAR